MGYQINLWLIKKASVVQWIAKVPLYDLGKSALVPHLQNVTNKGLHLDTVARLASIIQITKPAMLTIIRHLPVKVVYKLLHCIMAYK